MFELCVLTVLFSDDDDENSGHSSPNVSNGMMALPPPTMMNRMSPGVLPSGSPSAGLPGMLPSMTSVPSGLEQPNGETTPDSSNSPRAPITYPQSSLAPSVSIPSLVAAQNALHTGVAGGINPSMAGYASSVEFGAPSLAPALWPSATMAQWQQGYYSNK